jgi:hypothetical protein
LTWSTEGLPRLRGPRVLPDRVRPGARGRYRKLEAQPRTTRGTATATATPRRQRSAGHRAACCDTP